MSFRISVVATDRGVPSRSTSLNLLISVDTSLPSTSVVARSLGAESSDAMTNIYLIVFITFGVAISFVILVVAICFMSPLARRRACCCCGATRDRANGTRLKGDGGCTLGGSVPGGVTVGDGSVVTFGNGAEYVPTAGSTTYTLEKGSPIQYTQLEGVSICMI